MKDFIFSNEDKTFRIEYKTDHLGSMDNFTVHDIIVSSDTYTLDDLVRYGLNFNRLPYTYQAFKAFAVTNNLDLDILDYNDTSPTTLNTSTSLAITTTSLTAGSDAVAYSEQLEDEGGNGTLIYSLDETSDDLVAGLTLSESGLIAGTPTTSGTPDLVILITDQFGQTATKALTLTIEA